MIERRMGAPSPSSREDRCRGAQIPPFRRQPELLALCYSWLIPRVRETTSYEKYE